MKEIEMDCCEYDDAVCSILRYYALFYICGALGVSGHGLPILPPIGGYISHKRENKTIIEESKTRRFYCSSPFMIEKRCKREGED